MEELKSYTGSIYGGFGHLLYTYCQKKGLSVSEKLIEIQNLERFDLKIWYQLLKEIHKQYPTDGLGLDIAKWVQPKHLGVIGYISLTCENLTEFFIKYKSFHRLIYDGKPIQFNTTASHLCITWPNISPFSGNSVSDEVSLATFIHFLRTHLAIDEIPINEVHLRHNPQNIKIYESFFDCKVKCSQPRMQIILPIKTLDMATKQSDHILQHLLTQQAQTLLDELPSQFEMSERLRKSISKGLQKNNFQIEYIASQLNLSVRQLQRYLSQQNTTYQQTLQNVRKVLALEYLQDPYLSLQEISLLLSYSEQSAFQRAFKQWMGVTPQQWRSMKQKH
ncbi:AraC family transcriptional regulator [Acinetobacter sp. 194]|uniref:helix-turn-helix domain-containing protein n=1 Tax=Acinetobacter shaoyimingii TaxID=2715164 RepID=UPI00140B3BC2|nr:AraC family transcriptional regulator [Acinetobacter shaoyimingii]NHB56809.1 AraC family transcriptional regulator [Acinetobacter shaoyimingii]